MVKIKTQAQYDKLKDSTGGIIEIVGGTEYDRLNINRSFDNAEQRICESAYVDVSGSATIKYVSGSATIKYVSGSATIKYVSGSATIKYVSGSATIEYVSGSATIEYVSGSATIKYVSGSATILLVAAFAAILMVKGAAKVTTIGYNIVRTVSNEKDITLKLSKTTTLITLDEDIYRPKDFKSYKTLYPVEVKGTKATMYKAVKKYDDGTYHSSYNPSFTYEIGKTSTEVVDTRDASCSGGLHVSHKRWAIDFGCDWDDMALLECEVNTKDITVSSDTNGKVRTCKLKVIREVPKEEW
jgi:hypothetical protein